MNFHLFFFLSQSEMELLVNWPKAVACCAGNVSYIIPATITPERKVSPPGLAQNVERAVQVVRPGNEVSLWPEELLETLAIF